MAAAAGVAVVGSAASQAAETAGVIVALPTATETAVASALQTGVSAAGLARHRPRLSSAARAVRCPGRMQPVGCSCRGWWPRGRAQTWSRWGSHRGRVPQWHVAILYRLEPRSGLQMAPVPPVTAQETGAAQMAGAGRRARRRGRAPRRRRPARPSRGAQRWFARLRRPCRGAIASRATWHRQPRPRAGGRAGRGGRRAPRPA
eukprot:scaffold3099_cov100-Isochrysis_galbana.AAC.5